MFNPDENFDTSGVIGNATREASAISSGGMFGDLFGGGMFESIAGPLLSGFGGALASPAGPSQATGGRMDQVFDNSGWNVNFGSGGIDSNRSQATAGELGQYMPYLVLGVVVLVAWKVLKK